MIEVVKKVPGGKFDLGHRAYRVPADRRRAISMLRKRGYNYFVCYLEAGKLPMESGQRNALQYGKVEWMAEGCAHIDW